MAAAKTRAEKTWGTCQPHFNPGLTTRRTWFLPWHRLYLAYFENIVRKVLVDAGVADGAGFTLPYWDYVGTGSNASIPPEFRAATSALYEPKRRQGVNNGDPIGNGVSLDISALGISEFIDQNDALGMSPSLDSGIHGNVHSRVGQPGPPSSDANMGSVPTAGGDPIFWLHHCNIDRMWASWNEKAGGRNPNWGSRAFDFINEAGALVSAKASDATTTRQALAYEYDNLLPLQPFPAAALTEVARARPRTLADFRSSGGAKFNTGTAGVAWRPRLSQQQMSTGIRPAANFMLVLDDVSAGANGGAFNVFLTNDVDHRRRSVEEPEFVGTVSTFGAAGHDHGGGGQSLTLPLGDRLRDLTTRFGQFPQGVQVVPVDEGAGQPTIGRMSIVAL